MYSKDKAGDPIHKGIHNSSYSTETRSRPKDLQVNEKTIDIGAVGSYLPTTLYSVYICTD